MKKMVIAGNPSSLDLDNFLNKHTQKSICKRFEVGASFSETNPGHCLQAEFVNGIQELGRRRLLFDICIRPSELSDATSSR